MSHFLIQMITSQAPKAAKSFWSKHDGIYFPRGHDEEFAKSDVKYFQGHGWSRPTNGFPYV